MPHRSMIVPIGRVCHDLNLPAAVMEPPGVEIEPSPRSVRILPSNSASVGYVPALFRSQIAA